VNETRSNSRGDNYSPIQSGKIDDCRCHEHEAGLEDPGNRQVLSNQREAGTTTIRRAPSPFVNNTHRAILATKWLSHINDDTFCPPTDSLWLVTVDRLLHPPPPSAPEIDSLIVSDFPPLFEEFRAKRFDLLWWGSRDGITAQEFHRRCDGRADTLTLVSDTDGNVFGGFTPVEWESGAKWKGDDSLRSFFFTRRNPHGVPPRKFTLRAGKRQCAIVCSSPYCAAFGDSIDVHYNCNANRNSVARIDTCWSGRTYTNDTAFEDFLTGAVTFTVKEIEVFEIADSMALSADVTKCANGCLFQEMTRDVDRHLRGDSSRRLRRTGTPELI
jgi:hypothetical protein